MVALSQLRLSNTTTGKKIKRIGKCEGTPTRIVSYGGPALWKKRRQEKGA